MGQIGTFMENPLRGFIPKGNTTIKVPGVQPIIIAQKPYGSHKRDLTRSNVLAYTFILKRYLSAVGRDYVRNRLCLSLIVLPDF